MGTKELSLMSDAFVQVEMTLFCCILLHDRVLCQQIRADLVTEERGVKDSSAAETLSVWG